MPVARNLEASPPPSPPGESQARWLRSKLGIWVCTGVFVLSLLCWLVSLTVNEVWSLFAPPAAVVTVQQGQELDFSGIASDKLVSLIGDATSGLERWASPATPGGEDVTAAAARLSAEFSSVQDGVRALQESLAKSRSVGSVVGLVTWDHDKTQTSLKKEQAAVEEQSGEVLALARRIIQEHEEHQASRGGRGDGSGDGAAAVDGGGGSAAAATFQRPADEERELMNKLDFGLGEADVGGLLVRLQEVEAQINAAVPIQEAERMADRYAAAAARAGSPGGRAGGLAGEASDEDITRIVEEVVLSADPPLLPEGNCVSAELAQNLTRMELERYGADRTGIPDYAMGPAGARVIPSHTSDTYAPAMGFFERIASKRRKASLQSVSQPPVAINPESRLGMCWPMKGDAGKLTVKLSQTINVEAVSLEHAPRELLLNKGASAPKDFTVTGYRKDAGIADGTGDVLVSGGEYRLEGDVIQYFDVAEEYRQVEYSVVALEVDSNHGEGKYTCIYRFRVHGHPAA